ncbi:hypothetical protein EIP91_004461 [Steccherinum ochraceum]|uniref:Uncharacterized protein n=1 Tax=Steccherinum ochraceum TaxID=92696 RepID=A0A4R0RBD1_9APHY|nr:hypothetical protein EIP91_004461 [Steccherinum ochraceum]
MSAYSGLWLPSDLYDQTTVTSVFEGSVRRNVQMFVIGVFPIEEATALAPRWTDGHH